MIGKGFRDHKNRPRFITSITSLHNERYPIEVIPRFDYEADLYPMDIEKDSQFKRWLTKLETIFYDQE